MDMDMEASIANLVYSSPHLFHFHYISAIANQVDFSLHLFHHIASKFAPSSNLVLSPLSLHVALALLTAGSKGQTLDQLTSFLRSGTTTDLSSLASKLASLVLADASPSGGPVLAFCNAVCVDSSLSLKPSFRDVATSAFRAHAASLDFQTRFFFVQLKPGEAANNVNSWAEKKTQGLIKELLPSGSVNSATRLILSNALYFEGTWTQKFDTAKTEDLDFHLLDGSSVKVPFMTSSDKQFVSSFLDFKVLGMPYKHGTDGRRFSMYIFLPDAKDGLWSLAEKLGSGFQFLGRHIPMEKVSVSEFRIPKLKISYGFEASSPMKDLGLTLPFGGECDLTEMVDSTLVHKLFVSSIFHKSFVEVNEEGTEAAAASAAVFTLLCARRNEPVSFVADHPFIFFIREDVTGVVLFIGHVLNPCLTA